MTVAPEKFKDGIKVYSGSTLVGDSTTGAWSFPVSIETPYVILTSGGTADTRKLTLNGTTWQFGDATGVKSSITEAGAATFLASVTTPLLQNTAASTLDIKAAASQAINFAAGGGASGSSGNIASTNAWTIGPSTGFSAGYHTCIGSTVFNSKRNAADTTGLIAANDFWRIATNYVHVNGTLSPKALQSVTGVTTLSVNRCTAANSTAFQVDCTYQDAQTAGSDIVVTNLKILGYCSAAGEWFMPALSSGAGTYPLKWTTSTGLLTYDTSTRLVKKDIVDTPYGLSEILQLRPVKYKFISDDRDDLGLIAEEVAPIIPELCPLAMKKNYTKNEEDTELIPSFVNYDRLVSICVKAIQEQQEIIEQLKTRIEVLESK